LYNEFLKLKKNYNEEYLIQKKLKMMKEKYKNLYLSIPYKSMSELNVDEYINENLMTIQEKRKSRIQPKHKLTLKESSKSGRNKNKKQINQDTIIKKY
jgi:hypothetical protein